MTSTRAALLAGGVTGPALFVSAFTAIGASRTGYDPRGAFVSDLGRGPGGTVMRGTFVVAGLSILAGAEGVRRTPGTGAALPAALAVVGAGLALSGVFRTDGTDAPVASGEGRVHDVLGAAVFTALVVAPAVGARTAVLPPGIRRASAVAAVTTGAGNVLLKATQLVPGLAGVRGLVQRVVLVAGLGWIAAACGSIR